MHVHGKSAAELRAEYEAATTAQRTVAGRCKAIADRADAENRDLTADEARQLDKLFASGISAERLAALRDAALNAEDMEADAARRGTSGRKSSFEAPGNPRLALASGAGSSFAAMFNRAGQPVDGFQNWGELIRTALTDPTSTKLRNAATTYGSEGVGADGGFAVPVQFVDQLMDAALEEEAIRPRASVVPMTSKSVTLPAFDLVDGTNGKRAGLQLKWMAEAGAGEDQKATLREMTLSANKGAIFVPVTNECLDDAPNFSARLGALMSNAVAAGLDGAFVSGTGVGQPLGILNSAARITVSKESGQAANTLLLQNLAKMLARLAPRSYRRAVWLVNPTLLPHLFQLAIVIKNVAGSENVGGGVAAPVTLGADGQLRIYGLPVVVTDACSVLSTEGDIILADLSRYLITLRREAAIQTSIHAYWQQDITAFRLILRLNGQPDVAAPMKLRDGTNTVSPFVTLETR